MKTIALIVEFSRMYGRSLLEGIAAYAQENRNWILRPLAPEKATPEALKEYDGVIARIADDRLEELLREAGLPVVDVFCRKQRGGFGMVDSDHAAIGRLAAEFFLQRGFKNLAFCGTPGIPFSDQRSDAFRAVPRPDAGVTVDVYESKDGFSTGDSLFYGEKPDSDPDSRELTAWVERLPKPVAVFCCNDLRALQLLRAAERSGIRIPEEVSLLGVDNDTILCAFARIPISSIDPNAFKVGYDAARMLAAMIKGELPKKQHGVHSVPPGDINERASSEFKPFDPDWMGKVLIQIEKNLRHSFSARDVFRVSGRSISMVEKTFKDLFGMPVQRYINSVRMREAKRLLKEGKLPVTEIAYRCGYSSAQYFCRRFKDTFETSPKRYGIAARAEDKKGKKEPARPKRRRGRPRKGEEVPPEERAYPPADPRDPWKV